ncbi:MAG: hypothetical protein AAFY56_22030 [Pseudomonadota bacterium]
MMDRSVEERIKELESLALDLLYIAMEERDVRVALFLAEQIGLGKNPARSLAEAVNRKVTQATTPLDKPLSRPKKPSIDPKATRAAAARHYNARPWGPAVSAARQRLTREILSALASEAQEPATAGQPAIRPVRVPPFLTGVRDRPATASDIAFGTHSSPTALLVNLPRDGP